MEDTWIQPFLRSLGSLSCEAYDPLPASAQDAMLLLLAKYASEAFWSQDFHDDPHVFCFLSILLLSVVSDPKNTHYCIPCNMTYINALEHDHFVSKGVTVNMPMDVQKVELFEVLTAFLE
jgi:hypothetical protein